MKTLLKNLLIYRDQKIEKGDLAIEGGRFTETGGFTPDVTIDYHGKRIAIPGLINAHTHVPMGLFRNYADGLPLMEWLETKIWPAEEKLTHDDVYWGSMLGIAEMIRSGCTCFRDMYGTCSAVVRAADESGIRAVIGRGIVTTTGDEKFIKIRQCTAEFEKYNGSGNGRIKIEFAPHAPYTCDDEHLLESYREAERLNTGYHTHLSESDDEIEGSQAQFGMGPVERLDRLGVLTNRTSAAHCVKLTDSEIQTLAERGVSVLYNPSSNYKLGNGFAPIKKMMQAGINIAIGTDGSSSNNNLNMLEEIHLAAMINKGVEQDPTFLRPCEVLDMATKNGAAAVMIDSLGELKPGYHADLALIDTEVVHMVPLNNPLSALVYSAQGSDVTDTIVAGRFLMRERKLTTIDEAQLFERIREITAVLLD